MIHIIYKRVFFSVIALFVVTFFVAQVIAAPRFYLSGSNAAGEGVTHTLDVYLVSDGSTLTAAQTLITFDNTYLTAKSLSILGSACSFWAPADPSLGYGNTPTPYFYPTSNSSKVLLACGFIAPGYTSSDSTGDLVAKVRFTPILQGFTTLSFDDSNTLFRYIATTISPATQSDFNLGIYEATDSSTPTSSTSATPTASTSATATPTPTATSGVVVTDTLTEDGLTFVEIGVNSSGDNGVTTSEDVTLEVIDEDNTLPPVPLLDPRPSATPFVFSLLSDQVQDDIANEAGDVLAAQSLRELLIPGKSSADKTVVLINLISTLTFLVLLAVVIWRLVTITRVNKLKSQHMKELLASELSVLESKLGTAADTEAGVQIKQEIEDAMKKIRGDA